MENISEIRRCCGVTVLKYRADFADIAGEGAAADAARGAAQRVHAAFYGAVSEKIYEELCETYAADTDEKKRFTFPALSVAFRTETCVYEGYLCLMFEVTAKRRGRGGIPSVSSVRRAGMCFDAEGLTAELKEVFPDRAGRGGGEMNFYVRDGEPEIYGDGSRRRRRDVRKC